MNLNDALHWLETQQQNEIIDVDNTCTITKQQIQYKIQLPCGHAFEYDALYQNLMATQKKYDYHICPYCRKGFHSFIPYYETDMIRKYRHGIFRNNYLKCSHVYKSGKNKNCPCENHGHQFKQGIFCYRHKRQHDINRVFNIKVCTATLKSGKPCSCNMFDEESQLCKRHFNLRNKELKK